MTLRTQRLDSITGLRFVAALLVFGHHVGGLGVMTNEGLNFLRPGTVGVSFFFVLSGFVLTWTARDNEQPRLFWWKRFARIYPAYIAAWLGVLVVNIVSGDGVSPWDLLSATLLQAWVPSESAYFASSAVFWTLSVETFFYLVFPALILLVRRLTVPGLWCAMAGLVGSVVIVAFLVNPVERGTFGNWISSVFPPTRLLEFIIGMVLARLLISGALPRIALWLGCLVAATAFVVAAFVPVAFMSAAVTILPLQILLVAAAQADLNRTPSLLRGRIAVLLGDWSYSFYLTHLTCISVVVSLVERLVGDREQWDGLGLVGVIVACLIVSIGVAAALHYIVERPLERRLRGANSLLNRD
ncbi:acyltransferase [Plantibacter sp. T3]|uniref:acyltransferase family protein n=1 Tax=Plantibacter sp. T3 TaxID=2653161 RepID=UPI00135A41F3|nr:acyltransferase [Plantibacter sp. T3]